MVKISKGVDWRVVEAQSPSSPSANLDRESHTSPKDMFDQVREEKVRMHSKKAERKLQRRVKGDVRHSMKMRKQSSILPGPDLIQFPDSYIGELAVASHPLRETNDSTKVLRGLGTGRLALRHRHIQQKKMCMMDKRALNEVCVA